MHEVDVTLTNYLLALQTLYFTKRLHSIRTKTPLRLWSITFFAALTVALFLAGTVHGFLVDPASLARTMAWRLTVVFTGLAALAAWAFSAHLVFSRRTARWITGFAALEFLGYAWVVSFVTDDFQVVIVNYAISAAVMLFAFLKCMSEGRKGPFWIGTLGVVLTFVAASVQSNQIDLLGLSHNAVYHLIQGVGLFCAFIAMRHLSEAQESEAAQASPVPTNSLQH